MPELFGKFERQYSYKLYIYISFYQEKLSFLSQAQKSYFKKYLQWK